MWALSGACPAPRCLGERGRVEADTPPPLELCPSSGLSLLGPRGQGSEASLRGPARSPAAASGLTQGFVGWPQVGRGKAASPLSPQVQIPGALPFLERFPLPPSPARQPPLSPRKRSRFRGNAHRKDKPPAASPGTAKPLLPQCPLAPRGARVVADGGTRSSGPC